MVDVERDLGREVAERIVRDAGEVQDGIEAVELRRLHVAHGVCPSSMRSFTVE